MEYTIVTIEKNAALVSAVIGGVEVRRIVPADKAKDITAEVFDAGLEYGVPLEEIVKPVVHTADELEDLLVASLHNAGLWTKADFQDARRVLGAVQAVYGLDAGTIMQAVNAYGQPVEVAPKKAKKAKVQNE